jgi:PhnB protein
VNPIPEGMHTVTPSLTIANCGKAIDFYKKALGAEEVMRMPTPDGRGVWHAELKLGDSVVFLNDEMPGMSPQPPSAERPAPINMWLYVKDCDAGYQRAVGAGAASKMPPADMFWGDRTATVLDPFGITWTFATRVKDMTEAEMAKAGEEFARKMATAK